MLATKVRHKVMLPVVDKPLFRYAVKEVVAVGITDMIFVNGRIKRRIKNYFDKSSNLVTELMERGKLERLVPVRILLLNHVCCI